MAVMMAPAVRMARRMVRPASTISSLISDAVSRPANPKAMVAHRMMSWRLVDGTRSPAAIGVAGPKRASAMAPIATRKPIGIQVPRPPALCSHLPTPRPTTLSQRASARPASEKPMK